MTAVKNNAINLNDFFQNGQNQYLASVSVDNVIFGFHDGHLKVLLLQPLVDKYWMLPGGFIGKEESLDDAAARVLRLRTGLSNIYLQQFNAFGQINRKGNKVIAKALQSAGLDAGKDHWLLKRFISIGFFALVEYAKVDPKPDEISKSCQWFELDQLPGLIMDHQTIIEKALEEMRFKLKYQPIGFNLLPKTFTMKDLQSIYEAVLGRTLDRANFKRKMVSYNILDQKEKLFTGGSHKAPFLYSFNKKKYFRALELGLGADF